MSRLTAFEVLTSFDNEINTSEELIQYVKNIEQDWLMSNRKNKDFFKPQPMRNKLIKICFIGEYKEYINSEYNITNVLKNTKTYNIEQNKYDYAIKLYYYYNGNDDLMHKQEIISLYYIHKNMNLIHIKRIS